MRAGVTALTEWVRSSTGVPLLLAFVFVAFFYGRCSASNDGRDAEKARVAQAQADSAGKSAKAAWDSANARGKREKVFRDSLVFLNKKLADSKKEARVANANYRTLRDSVKAAPHDSTTDRIIAAADSALAADSAVIAAHEAKDVQQDSLIASQATRITFLGSALSEKDKQVQFLNTRIAVEVRRRKRARFESAAIGVGVAGFAVITYKGMH